MALLRPGVRVHMVGIGGIGLSAIARVLHGWGYRVSGSDRCSSPITSALTAEGIKLFIGHHADNVKSIVGSEPNSGVLVIVSSAVPDGNPEVMEALRLGFPVVKRRQMLGELTSGKTTVAVAGTHGKTTTTAMIAWILVAAGLNPSFVVGGMMQNLTTNGAAGSGPHFVIEADEYERAFLGLTPDVAVLLSAEHDHPDCYPNWEDLREAFSEFADRIAGDGSFVVCGDDPEAIGIAERAASRASVQGSGGMRVITYGLGPGWDWRAAKVRLQGSPSFEVQRDGRAIGTCALQLPGVHSVQNALAALAVTAELGVETGVATNALTRFRGTARRFEVKGQAAGVTVVDDYAHHPTEIRATLGAARLRYPGQSIWAVFQPHTFSRTAVLLDGFASAFDEADHILVTDIYAAREKNTYGISSTDLVACIRARTPPRTQLAVRHVGSFDEAVTALLSGVKPGDVVITLGAGDGCVIGERLLSRLSENEDPQGGVGTAPLVGPSTSGLTGEPETVTNASEV